MIIRPADLSDLNACIAIDPSFQTDYVWQMEERDDGTDIFITFRPARLPRTMPVAYPRGLDNLPEIWNRDGCFLVAETEDGEISGFLSMIVQDWHNSGWIQHLIVDQRYRRQGIGSALLGAAVQWAREQGLSRLVIEVQTKNYPAIRFCQKHGFAFCGFNDRYYANQDIALFFALSLR